MRNAVQAEGAGPLIFDGPGRVPPSATVRQQQLFDELLALSKSGTKLGLIPLERVLGLLGNPERRYRTVHVAGSNGKGSTCAFLAAILAAHGRRVGLYTSPHLIRLSERVQRLDRGVAPEELGAQAFEAALLAVKAVAPDYVGLSFFEAITAAGFLALADWGVEVAVIEAGLGARLDATRLVDAEVAVLTELSLEHTDILGETIEEITREEGAVIRPGRPLVCAGGPDSAMVVLDSMVNEAGAQSFRIGREIAVTPNQDGSFEFDLGDRQLSNLNLSLLGPHQGRNALLAAKAALLMEHELSEAAIREGLARARWPGRMEILRRAGLPPVLLDGAHNAQGADALAAGLVAHRAMFEGSLHFVFGVLLDKDETQMMKALAPLASSMVFTRPSSVRARDPATLVALAEACGARCVEVAQQLTDAFERAVARAKRDGGWVVVAGSLYLVGEVRALILEA